MNIQPHIDKLEALKEWISIKVDRAFEFQKGIALLKDCGILCFKADANEFFTFESWYEFYQGTKNIRRSLV